MRLGYERIAHSSAAETMQLVVTTMLPAEGCCGVQTHFQGVSDVATRAGISVRVASPYDASRWARRATNATRRLLEPIDPELAVLWGRASLARHLRTVLTSLLGTAASSRITVYAQDPLSAEVALAVRRRGRPFRVVEVVHFNVSEANEYASNRLTRPGGRLWRDLMAREARVLPNVDALIFVSDFMRRVVALRLPEIARADVHVIPNFARALPDRPAALDVEGDVISIGTLEPRKNQSFLLEVVAAASSLGHRYRLTFAGDGPSRQDLEHLAVALRIRDQVTFLGYVPDAASLIPGHRVLAHAAQMENCAIVFLEAMQHGVPPIAAAVGGTPELFRDGVEGRFWPLDDVRRAADILIETLECDSVHAAMAAAARLRYRSCFSLDVLAPRWLDAICGHPQSSRAVGTRAPGNVGGVAWAAPRNT